MYGRHLNQYDLDVYVCIFGIEYSSVYFSIILTDNFHDFAAY